VAVELVSIGTELLLGFTVDTNAAWIGRFLAAHGIRVARRATVADDPQEIREAVRAALGRTGMVITTGGLGPTRDDITREAIAGLFGRRLVFDQAVWDDLAARYGRLGRAPGDANRPQADVPEGAVVLPNPHGTAPGLWLEGPAGVVIMLPGVPREMRGLMETEVLPRLATGGPALAIVSRTLRTAGIPESGLAARIGDAETAIAPLTLAYLPEVGGVDLRLTAWELPPDEAGHRLDAAAALLRYRAGDHVYGEDGADLAAVVLEHLTRRGLHLAVAESCTGGMLAGRFTAIPGSSRVFRGAVVPYDDRYKTVLLGVGASVIEEHGAVSEPVALGLADGAARNFQAEVAVGITGLAGPAGGSGTMAVGTVWFGFVVGAQRWAERAVFPGSREEIRTRAVQLALFRLHQALTA